MVEVLRSPVSIHISLHRLNSQQSHSTHKTKFCQQCLNRRVDFCSSNGKRNRKDVDANRLKMASMVQEVGSWLRVEPLESPGGKGICRTTKMNVNKIVLTRPEHGLVCQGNGDNISNPKGREEISSEKMLPPWGNLHVQEESNISISKREEEISSIDSAKILPPWGNLHVQEESNISISKREEEISSIDSAKMLPPWGNLHVQEESNISISKREEEISSIDSAKMLPPWGNLDVQEESSFESGGVSSPSNSGRINGVTLEHRLHFLEERNEDILSKRILGLSRLNKFRSAFDLYMSMEVSGLQPNLHACNSLISCLLRNGLLNNALEVFEIMKKKKKTTGHTYSLILKAIADTDGYDSAIKMFMALEGESTERNAFDAIVYNTMISICGKTNNWVQTEKLWKTMKENGHQATTVTYSLLVSTFTRCGQPDLAFDAYSEMVQNRLEPSEDMMQAIISASTKEGKWALALDVFENMLHSGLNPNIISYNSLINSLGKAGEVNLAFGVFKHMQSSGHKPDVYTWNALLSALYRGERYADALQLFESIKREQKSQLNSHLYNTALMSCKRLGEWDRSLQLIWQMEASGLPVSTESYNLVIDACEVGREPKVALQVYEHMVHKNCTPNTFTYLSLIRACIWGSLWPEVEKILDLVTPDVSLYNAAIHGMCLQGKITVAKKLYMKMRDKGLKPDGKTRAMMLQNLKRDTDRRIRRPNGRRRWTETIADFEGFFPP